jgi:hypothetical protein
LSLLFKTGVFISPSTTKEFEMTRKLSCGMIMLVAFFMFIGCGGGKYSDAIKVNTQFVDATENYVSALEKADNAGAVADAVDAYAAKVEKIAPRMKKLAEKYPELKDQNNVPEELKESQKKATAVGLRMAGSFMKAMKHMGDAKVKAAHERLQKAMALMM